MTVNIPTLNFQAGQASLRGGVSFNPVGNQAEAALFKNLSNQLNQQVEYINAKEDERVARESQIKGMEAGVEDGFDANGLPEPNTIAAKSFRQGALETFTNKTQTDIETKLGQLAVENDRNPERFRIKAQQIIDDSTSGIPTEARLPLQDIASKKANAAYVAIMKSELARQRAYQEQATNDRISLIAERLAKASPNTAAEIEANDAETADLLRTIDNGIAAQHITPAHGQKILMDIEAKQQVNVVTEYILGSANPQEMALQIAEGTTGDPLMDQLPQSTRLTAMRVASEKQSALDAIERRATEAFEQNREANFNSRYKRAAMADNPLELDEIISEMETIAVKPAEVDRIRQLRDNIASGDIGFSDPQVLASTRLQVFRNEVTEDQIVEKVASGAIRQQDAATLISELNANQDSLINSPAYKNVVQRIEEMYPSKGPSIDLGFAIPGVSATQIIPENVAAQDAFLSAVRETIISGEGISTQKELQDFATSELNKLTQLEANIPLAAKDSPAYRFVAAKVTNSEKLKGLYSTARNTLPAEIPQGMTMQEVILSKVGEISLEQELSKTDKAELFFLLQEEYAND